MPDDPEFKVFPPHCVEGSGEDEVIPELQEFADRGTVVRKRTFSGFQRDGAGGGARAADADVIEVAGVCTDICVLHTVADLRVRGYDVLVHKISSTVRRAGTRREGVQPLRTRPRP